MTIPGTAKDKGDLVADADRETVEFDGSTLLQLRELDPEGSGLDRDTIEISTAESLSLASKAEGPSSSPSASGEVQVPQNARRSLADLDADGVDRAALHTIPSPPLFEDEDE